jgi:protein-S-isoprenylcysteine O-methyltransferase Ste14
LTASIDQFRAAARRDASLLSSLLFVMSMLGWSYMGKSLALAIYSLSFWHYYLYWLAYYFGAVPLGVFKRDAIFMKTVSLVALGSVYLAAPRDLASLAVVASGFLLNCFAAGALGADRTYYGFEVAELPALQITTFPYSWISHPMLAGNIAAFGGTMIDADFRRGWWPLACTHVAMNLGLLVMELAVTPQRLGRRRTAIHDADSSVRHRPAMTRCCIAVAGAALVAAFGFWETWCTKTLFATAAGVCISAYAYALYRCYSLPSCLPDNPRNIPTRDNLWFKHWGCRR